MQIIKPSIDRYKYILPVGFSIIISIMIFISLFAVSSLNKNSDMVMETMSQQNVSHNLLKDMSETAFSRENIILEMLLTEDPFVNDELFLKLYDLTDKFERARTTFEGLEHAADLRTLLDAQGALSNINLPIQIKLYELIQLGKLKEATILFKSVVLSNQKSIIRLVDEMGDYEETLYQNRFNGLKKESKNVLTTVFVFDLIGILFSILLTIFVLAKQRTSDSKLARIAGMDVLTELPNRSNFLNHIDQHIKVNPSSVFALVFFDIDYFKSINDNYGHEVGDEILKRFSENVCSHISDNDVLARFGGDEFVLMLRSVETELEVMNFISRLSVDLDTSFVIDNDEVFISSSIGVSLYKKDGKSAKTLLKHADIAMYSAKRSGRNCFRFFSKETSEKLAREHSISHALHSVIKSKNKNDELHLLYQPLMNINNNDITECEALIRWRTHDGEIIYPDEFIPLAEKSNVIEKINLLVIDEACKQQSEWQKLGINNIRININLSGNKIVFDKVLQQFKHNLKTLNLKASSFGIELTERTINKISQDAIDQLYEIRALGMKISIDDFGTDYSSLIYLKKLPITTLKIDKTFIRGLMNSKEDDALVKTIITLAHSLGLDVVAEGVETSEQLEYLKSHSCNIAQGYYFHKPLESVEISELKLAA